MSRQLEAALVLRAKDEASRPLLRALQQVDRQAGATGQAIGQAGKAGAGALAKMATDTQSAERAVVGLSRENQRMHAARQQLGMRAEQTIQREIRQTEAAYNRLLRTGQLTATEQARAFQAMRDKVAALRREMQGVADQESRLGKVGRGAAAIGGGVAAAAYVLNRPLASIEDYDLRLRNMTNTAYADRDLAGRRAGMVEMREVIRRSGGNRDAAAEALDNMIASGSLGEGDAGRKAAFDMLPVVMKYATAGNANPNELVDIALKARKTFNIQDPARALEMALLGGQLGGFEMKDMAKWLPQQMANASMAGMSGDKGLAKLVALNQSAVVAAGSKDQAGNNVVNFLAKLNASETAGDFKKVGVNWRQQLIDGAKGGKDAVDVFGDTINGLLNQNAAYRKLQARLGTTTGEEQKATLASMAKILQGAVVGKISSDQQELMGVLAYLNNRQQQAENERKIMAAKPGQASDTNFALINESAAYKGLQASNAFAEAQFDALKGLSESVGDTKLKLVDYAKEYPGLSTALVGAGTAVSALAAAAGAAAIPLMMMGGGRKLPGMPTSGAGSPMRGWSVAGAGLGLSAVSIANFTSDEEDDEIKNGEARWKKLRATYGQKAIDAARKRYQPWWQFGEGYASENEAWLKRYQQDEAKTATRQAPIVQSRNLPTSAAPIPQLSLVQSAVNASNKLDAAALKMQQAANQPVQVQLQVKGDFRIQGNDLVATVNQQNTLTARRN